jgi:hypothetical protein
MKKTTNIHKYKKNFKKSKPKNIKSKSNTIHINYKMKK